MQALFSLALHPLNLFYSVLLGLVILYWFSVILGAVDISAFDLDFDADVDVDADLDVDAHAHAHIDTDVSASGWFASALHFLHFDRLPFMLIISLVVIAAWSMSVLSNHYWGAYSTSFGLAMAGPILLASFLSAKILSYPFIPLFGAINQAAAPVEYVGMICRVKLPPSGNKFGQAGVQHAGDQLLVNIKSRHLLSSGQDAVIIGQTEDKRYWLVEPLEPDEGTI